jgi:predicted RNase H-like nuclease
VSDGTLVGVDGCPAGWVAVRRVGADLDWHVRESFGDVLAATDPDRLLLDMPVGLPAGERRRCDELARELLGDRAATVFYTPCRAVLDAESHAEASDRNRDATGAGLSIQAWNLVPKIREVDAVVRARPELVGVDGGAEPPRRRVADAVVRESHPELCFRALNGGSPVAASKATDEGRRRRLDLLDAALPGGRATYETVVAETYRKDVARDDVVDALGLLAAATGPLRSLPETPPLDAAGVPMEIVCPAGECE